MPSLEKAIAYARTDAAKLVFCTFGVVTTLLLYSVMQEKIMKGTYGEEAVTFKYALFLVLSNRVLTAVVTVALMVAQKKRLGPTAPLYKYGAISISNVVATTCQYEALRHVSMAIQTLAKCAKMLPVMIWGTIIMQKRYGCHDYSLALFVTTGCTIFLMAANSKTGHHKEVQDSFWGALTMLGYLGFDGFTSTFQDKLFKGYNMEIYNQILYVTLWSCAFSAVGLVGAGQWLPAIEFVIRQPSCLFDIFLLSAAATTAQFFISYTIKTFGALVFATIMTTRQLLTILLSCALFGHSVTLGQWLGMVLVFGSLYYKAYTTKGKKERVEEAGGEENGGKLKDLESNGVVSLGPNEDAVDKPALHPRSPRKSEPSA